MSTAAISLIRVATPASTNGNRFMLVSSMNSPACVSRPKVAIDLARIRFSQIERLGFAGFIGRPFTKPEACPSSSPGSRPLRFARVCVLQWRAVDKTVAIVQSNYIPWIGYFDLINAADAFILFDEVQFTRRDWRNRNRIRTADGVAWLTIPVESKGRFHQRISETRVSDPGWARDHWTTIVRAYARAAGFETHRPLLEDLYLGCAETQLSRINERFLRGICGALGIATPITQSSEYELVDGRTERLVSLCRQAGATTYLTGPGARTYLDEALFADAGIAVEWMTYPDYGEYRQLHQPFEPGLSIVDLLLNEGTCAPMRLPARVRTLHG